MPGKKSINIKGILRLRLGHPETVLLLSRRYDHAFTKKYPLKVYGSQYLKGLASA